MKYKDFFTEMSSLGMNFSAPQPDFDTYTEEVSDDFSVFAQKRFDGAKKISDTAKEKGGPATLTHHHFVVKLPYYQKAIDGAFNVEEATQELEQHLQKLSGDAATMEQIEFQELVGIIEVLGELIIKQTPENTMDENLEKACWDGYEAIGMKEKNGKMVPNCVPINENELYEGDFCKQCLVEYMRKCADMLQEAEYQGRKVPLGKPMRGDVKKFRVYVKDPKTGNVKKVNFGDKKMRIKKSNPKRRKSFRARHKCQTAKDRTTARYWSCKAW
jgi:hypothetical protein